MTQPLRTPSTRRAFTLIELVLATAILAIVGVTVSSVLMVAARSSPPASGGSATSVEVADAFAQMSLDVGLASQFYATDEFYISFLGPDADGDDVPDEILYGYNSASGGQFLRSIAGETSVVHQGVSDARFWFLTDSVTVDGATWSVVRSVGVRIHMADGTQHRRVIRCVGLPAAL